ncbi:MAG: protein kinase [Zetaproteobacteria bacterium]|nr:protein kinase [Zetaproteobacteria bacterium]
MHRQRTSQYPTLLLSLCCLLNASCREKHPLLRIFPTRTQTGSPSAAPPLTSSYSDPLLVSNVDSIYHTQGEASLALMGSFATKFFAAKKLLAGESPRTSLGDSSPRVTGSFNPQATVPQSPSNEHWLPPVSPQEGPAAAAAHDTLVRTRQSLDKGGLTPVQVVTAKLRSKPLQELMNIEEIRYKKAEDSVLVIVDKEDPLLQDIRNSPSQSIIRDHTEYRILHTGAHSQSVVLHAFNLTPKLKSPAIKTKIRTHQTFVPETTFRNDPTFSTKIAITQQLGKLKLRLREGLQANLQVAGTTYPLQVIEELGTGSAGQVFLVRIQTPSPPGSLELAIKQPIPTTLAQQNASRATSAEVYHDVVFLDAMSRHPNAMQFYGAYPIGGGHYNMVLEALEGSWDTDQLSNKSFEDVTRMIIGVADGMSAMHAGGFVHLDLKPENLFFHGNQGKIGDYGFAQQITQGRIPSVHDHGTYVPIDLIDLGSTGASGDITKVDTFATGLSMIRARYPHPMEKLDEIMFACCTLDVAERDWYVVDGERFFHRIEADLMHLPTSERELIRHMISNDPKLRPTMQEVAKIMREIHNLRDI